MTQIKIFSDGGARGNPGPAATGYIIYKEDEEIFSAGNYLGETTNNVAEYSAILEALETLIQNLKIKEANVDCFLDSQLVVKQLAGEYKVKNAQLATYHAKIQQLITTSNLTVSFTHIPREKNSQADALVNQTLDARKD